MMTCVREAAIGSKMEDSPAGLHETQDTALLLDLQNTLIKVGRYSRRNERNIKTTLARGNENLNSSLLPGPRYWSQVPARLVLIGQRQSPLNKSNRRVTIKTSMQKPKEQKHSNSCKTRQTPKSHPSPDDIMLHNPS